MQWLAILGLIFLLIPLMYALTIAIFCIFDKEEWHA